MHDPKSNFDAGPATDTNGFSARFTATAREDTLREAYCKYFIDFRRSKVSGCSIPRASERSFVQTSGFRAKLKNISLSPMADESRAGLKTLRS